MELPILYSFRRCPYAMRARLALQRAEIKSELREVVLRDRPEHMMEISPKGTVPVMLLQDGTLLEESLDIMDYAAEKIDSICWKKESMTNFDEMISKLDGEFKHNLDRYKYPNRYDDVDAIQHRDANIPFLQMIDDLLTDNEFLSGKEMGILDCVIFPFIRQFANHDRDWFDNLPLEKLLKWLDCCLSSEEFKIVMKKYKQWTPEQDVVIWP